MVHLGDIAGHWDVRHLIKISVLKLSRNYGELGLINKIG